MRCSSAFKPLFTLLRDVVCDVGCDEWVMQLLVFDTILTKNFLVLLFSVVTDDNPPSMQKSRDCAASCRDKRSR